MNSRVLFVDDEERILKGIKRQLRKKVDLEIALGPIEALRMVKEEGPFAVVISDMRMPEMTGAQLLKEIRDHSPDTVRMLLTGYSEIESTVEAINQGHVFKFLNKPCQDSLLLSAIEEGLEQYRLITAERELVEGTLRGSVDMLSNVLSLVNPIAFGKATRIRRVANGIAKYMDNGLKDLWKLDVAAMLAPLGLVSVPPEILEKRLAGETLSDEESEIFQQHPQVARDLVKSIPRLEDVAAIISLQDVRGSENLNLNDSIGSYSCILRIANDYDDLVSLHESSIVALGELEKNADAYHENVFNSLIEFVRNETKIGIEQVKVVDLVEGMVIAEDIVTESGLVLVSTGHTISSSVLSRLDNFSKHQKIIEPIQIQLFESADQLGDRSEEQAEQRVTL